MHCRPNLFYFQNNGKVAPRLPLPGFGFAFGRSHLPPAVVSRECERPPHCLHHAARSMRSSCALSFERRRRDTTIELQIASLGLGEALYRLWSRRRRSCEPSPGVSPTGSIRLSRLAAAATRRREPNNSARERLGKERRKEPLRKFSFGSVQLGTNTKHITREGKERAQAVRQSCLGPTSVFATFAGLLACSSSLAG